MTDHDAARARAAAQAYPDSALGRSTNPWPDAIVQPIAPVLPELDRSWVAQAACRGTETAMFYPERGELNSGPIEICRACHVRRDCLRYALLNNEKIGIWGGKSEKQRRVMRRLIAINAMTVDELLDTHADDDGIAHGTAAGYRAHVRRQVVPCADCHRAWATYQASRKTKEAS